MTTLTVARFFDGKVVTVGKIVCLGLNYAEHVKESGGKPPTEPILFLKPSTAIVHNGGLVRTPSFSSNVHHEVELVALIGKGGKNIPRPEAMKCVGGYAVGLDMTLRDVQRAASEKGMPWTVAKGFDTSAPISDAVRAGAVPDPHSLDIQLSVNGRIRQKSNTSKMIFKLDQIIEYVSSIFTLEEGDLIFTGTPDGVGPVVPGDIIEASIEKVGELSVSVR